MLEHYLDAYIDELYKRENSFCSKEQKSLFTKDDYYKLLRPVINLISENKDESLDELRSKLYELSGLDSSVKKFVYEKEIVSGLVFSYGTKNYKETIVIGNKEEVRLDKSNNLVPSIESMSMDTIFDLASVTKVFTMLSILLLVSRAQINLNDEVVKYASEFKNLKGVTILDLLSFQVPLKTSNRIDKCSSRDEAEKLLFNISVDTGSNNLHPYTDMGAMVLKYVVEHVSGVSFYDYIDENILKKLGLNDTHVVVPKYKLSRVSSTNADVKYYKDGSLVMNNVSPIGVTYDPKAKIMGQSEGNLSGHAGMFSTVDDMIMLEKGIISGKIINDKYMEMISKNRTGREYKDSIGAKKYVQYLGLLCYSKNPILHDSELFHAMSGKSFSTSGYTGTKGTVDPLNEIFFFLSGNRTHNRLTYVDESRKKEIITNNNGKKYIILPDGKELIDSTDYVWERDDYITNKALMLALQYKMLEDIYSYSESEEEVKQL